MSYDNMREGEWSRGKKNKMTIETVAKTKSLGQNEIVVSNRHGAAVPISLYREVAAELEANKARLSALNEENQRLKSQNQLLRQEVLYLLRSTHSQKNINRSFLIEPQQTQSSVVRERVNRSKSSEIPIDTSKSKLAERIPPFSGLEKPAGESEESLWIAEMGQNFSDTSDRPNRAMNGWLLALSIVLIIGTAFTAGFLLVRPLIDGNNESN